MLLYTNHCHCMMWFEPGKKKKKEKKELVETPSGRWCVGFVLYVLRSYSYILYYTALHSRIRAVFPFTD